MSLRGRVGVIGLWVASLVFVEILGSAQTEPPPQTQTPLEQPVVLSGGDVGFRVEGRRGDVPRGQIVVRINGAWVPVEIGTGNFR
jgi:hypothetical protein